MSNETHSDDDSIACPACGELIKDLWDYNWHGNPKSVYTECSKCGAAIRITSSLSVSYTARKL